VQYDKFQDFRDATTGREAPDGAGASPLSFIQQRGLPVLGVAPGGVLAERYDGCDLLGSNVPDWTAEELWKAYVQLTDAKAAFRIQKLDLRLRPVWHQAAERVRAQILVCSLAYVLRKTLDGWSQRAGLGRSVPTLLEDFAWIQSTDVILRSWHPLASTQRPRAFCRTSRDPS
jgi:hypothetical protein